MYLDSFYLISDLGCVCVSKFEAFEDFWLGRSSSFHPRSFQCDPTNSYYRTRKPDNAPLRGRSEGWGGGGKGRGKEEEERGNPPLDLLDEPQRDDVTRPRDRKTSLIQHNGYVNNLRVSTGRSLHVSGQMVFLFHNNATSQTDIY